MSLSGYSRRRRKELQRRIGKIAFFAAVVVTTLYLAYATGQKHVQRHDAELQRRIDELEAANIAATTAVRQSDASVHLLEGKLQQAETRYQQDVPTGDLARLNTLMAERLKSGIGADRMAFVIGATQNPRDCKPAESKRFILPAGTEHGTSNATVAFANGTITVSGQGIAHRDPNGNPSGWFDPEQPVTIKFVTLGGNETVAQGPLPLHQSLVIGNVEHRFTIAAGSRSLVEVTADSCSFP